MADTFNVLFISSRNSARSIMAEAWLRQLGRPRFSSYSAGSFPANEVHPLALKSLAAMGLPTHGLASKSWSVFGGPEAPKMDFVFTVCDIAAGEVCPVWPGHPVSAYWGVDDPAVIQGSDERVARAFHDAAMLLKRRIELFLALPDHKRDALSLQHELNAIGRAGRP
jgi:arsenate reductase (thioredoxin)